jgi:uncharacterized membrane protein
MRLKDIEMSEATPSPSMPAEHVEETVRSIERVRAEHRTSASPPQRAVARMTAFVSRPALVFVLATLVVAWVGANAIALALGGSPLDRPPFPWLQGAGTLVSLFLVVLVLGAQRHEDEVGERREMLALELAILSEQKSAKIIRMLEEFRRDHPQMLDRVDREADAMAQPANPSQVLDAIKETKNQAGKTDAAKVEASPHP